MKPLIITDEFKQEALNKFQEELKKYNGNGAFNFKFAADVAIPDEYKAIRPKVYFTPVAYLKMSALINTCDKEIAWHGYVDVLDTHTYLIHDIMCYPQKVAGAAVDSDDDKYGAWLQSIPNDKIKSLRFQGHSHVNMGVSPSATDVENWHNLSKLVRADGYYIFCIANKKGNIEFHLADKKLGVMFEPKEIDYAVILGDDIEVTLKAWANDAIEDNIKEIASAYPVRRYNSVEDLYNVAAAPYSYNAERVATVTEFVQLYNSLDFDYIPELEAFITEEYTKGFRWDAGFKMFKKEVTRYIADLYNAGQINTNPGSNNIKVNSKRGGKKK